MLGPQSLTPYPSPQFLTHKTRALLVFYYLRSCLVDNFFLILDTIALLFVFTNYCLTMN